MMNLESLYEKSSDKMRKDALRGILTFPATLAFANRKSLVTINCQDRPNWSTIFSTLKCSPELIAMNAINDIRIICEAFKEAQDEWHFEKFDSIRIFRGGSNLFRVVNQNVNMGLSVTLEINEYKKRLHQLVYPETKRNYYAIVVPVIVACVIGAFVVKKRFNHLN